MPFRCKGAVMFDLQGRIAFASTYFCDLVGVEHDRVARMSYLDFVFAEDVAQAKTIFEHQTATGEIYAISATVTAAEAPPS